MTYTEWLMMSLLIGCLALAIVAGFRWNDERFYAWKLLTLQMCEAGDLGVEWNTLRVVVTAERLTRRCGVPRDMVRARRLIREEWNRG